MKPRGNSTDVIPLLSLFCFLSHLCVLDDSAVITNTEHDQTESALLTAEATDSKRDDDASEGTFFPRTRGRRTVLHRHPNFNARRYTHEGSNLVACRLCLGLRYYYTILYTMSNLHERLQSIEINPSKRHLAERKHYNDTYEHKLMLRIDGGSTRVEL